MVFADLEGWIEERYGPPRITGVAPGVVVAVVPVMGGVAIGAGDLPSHALYDLYCDLVSPGYREPFDALPPMADWQLARRAAWDAEKV